MSLLRTTWRSLAVATLIGSLGLAGSAAGADLPGPVSDFIALGCRQCMIRADGSVTGPDGTLFVPFLPGTTPSGPLPPVVVHADGSVDFGAFGLFVPVRRSTSTNGLPSLPDGFMPPASLSLPPDLVLPPGFVVPANLAIPTGGFTFPPGAVIPRGLVISPDAVLGAGDIVESGTVLPPGVAVPPSITLPPGSRIASLADLPGGTTALPNGALVIPGLFIPPGVMLPPGVTLPTAITSRMIVGSDGSILLPPPPATGFGDRSPGMRVNADGSITLPGGAQMPMPAIRGATVGADGRVIFDMTMFPLGGPLPAGAMRNFDGTVTMSSVPGLSVVPPVVVDAAGNRVIAPSMASRFQRMLSPGTAVATSSGALVVAPPRDYLPPAAPLAYHADGSLTLPAAYAPPVGTPLPSGVIRDADGSLTFPPPPATMGSRRAAPCPCIPLMAGATRDANGNVTMPPGFMPASMPLGPYMRRNPDGSVTMMSDPTDFGAAAPMMAPPRSGLPPGTTVGADGVVTVPPGYGQSGSMPLPAGDTRLPDGGLMFTMPPGLIAGIGSPGMMPPTSLDAMPPGFVPSPGSTMDLMMRGTLPVGFMPDMSGPGGTMTGMGSGMMSMPSSGM